MRNAVSTPIEFTGDQEFAAAVKGLEPSMGECFYAEDVPPAPDDRGTPFKVAAVTCCFGLAVIYLAWRWAILEATV